jgi:hypothetical protein
VKNSSLDCGKVDRCSLLQNHKGIISLMSVLPNVSSRQPLPISLKQILPPYFLMTSIIKSLSQIIGLIRSGSLKVSCLAYFLVACCNDADCERIKEIAGDISNKIKKRIEIKIIDATIDKPFASN